MNGRGWRIIIIFVVGYVIGCLIWKDARWMECTCICRVVFGWTITNYGFTGGAKIAAQREGGLRDALCGVRRECLFRTPHPAPRTPHPEP